jgi:elongator complex protein 4
VGLLHLRKLPGIGVLLRPTPEVSLFLIRHKRRRLAIEAVDIDPDAEAAAAGAAGHGSKPASAALCGGPPNAETVFDF